VGNRFTKWLDMKKENRRRFVKYVLTGVGVVAIISAYIRFGRMPPTGKNMTFQTSSTSGSKSRLPPGQYEVKELQVLHIDGVPSFDPNTWNFEVLGFVKKPFVKNWSEFQSLSQMEEKADFHCVTGWSKLGNGWSGVSFKTIYDLAEPTEEARFATIICEVGYSTSLPVTDLLRGNVLFAVKLDGKPLEPKHGGPLRLIVPDKYAYKSAKWVRKVKFTKEQELGYWEARGYSATADPWTQDRYS
jgi:DMSO/TMAO reductase YedYZ molybdopterin-dependent catalytic subunit